MKKNFLIAFFLLAFGSLAHAQEIHFGQYGHYDLTVGELNSNDLDFGQLISGSGKYSKDINNGKIITITGVEYLDVIVDVQFSDLYLNGNPANANDAAKHIPFNLEAAYANNKGTPNIGKAKFITNITGNSFTVRFPILERQSQPPGPPPPPPTNAFDQSKVEDTAYLYLYGSITVGNVNAGSYSSDIIVTISYD